MTTEFVNPSRFSRCIYHCVDEIKAQPGMPVGALEAAEKRLASTADIIFATSRKLAASRRVWNANTHYFPNVADYSHFSSATSSRTKIPIDLESIPRPRVGFIGAISAYKLDFQLIRRIAEFRPNWSVILIGEVGEGDPWTDSSLLASIPNVHLLGPRTYSELPAYLKGFDVAMLPNAINEYTDSMFPMKFFEYLAAGCPVVSVDLAAIGEFADFVTIARSPEEFVAAVDSVLAGEVPSAQKRMELARKYTYEERNRSMLAMVAGTPLK